MLNIHSDKYLNPCESINRRSFLQIGSLAIAGLTLPDLLRLRAENPNSNRKSVIWLWLGGGATHIETFDPKPSAPLEFRSMTGTHTTNVPGIELGGNFEQLAYLADKLAIVRSFSHGNSGHAGGTHWVMTGYNHTGADNNEPQRNPGMGAIVSRYRGTTNPHGMPTYIKMGTTVGEGPVWLGQQFAPFDMAGEARNNLSLHMSLQQLQDRQALRASFDSINNAIDRSGSMASMDSFGQQATQIITSNIRDAFDISRESLAIRNAYGVANSLGHQLLTARRLIEAGAGFVTVHHGGWDHHTSLLNNVNRMLPVVDHAVSCLIQDLNYRGLLDDTLLVITGEFGRTPRINSNGGRDHWSSLSTLALAGGGLRTGQIIGESSPRAEYPRSHTVSPQDLMATVFRVLDIPQDLIYNDNSGRPIHMIQNGRPIAQLF